jgi:hypothetical protein
MLRSKTLVTGAPANATIVVRVPARGRHYDCALRYVAGRPSALRGSNGAVIDIDVKTLASSTGGGPFPFEALGQRNYSLVLDLLMGLNSILAP